MKTIFEVISSIFKKTRVSCVLIGGFAVNFYHVTRQTVDVDFLITEEDLEKVAPLLEKEGFRKNVAQKIFVRFKGNKLYLMDIDFLFVDSDTLDKIVRAGKRVAIGRHAFIVPSLENLIALKLHSLKYNFRLRENRDLPDIIELIRKNKLDARSKNFKELCLKYGTEDIYRKIMQRLR